VHNLAAACRCVLSEAHIRANVNRGPRRLAVQEQSNGRTRRFRGEQMTTQGDSCTYTGRSMRDTHAGMKATALGGRPAKTSLNAHGSSSRSARELPQRWNSPRLTRTTTRTSSSIPTAASGSARLMCVKTQFTADRRAATCWSEGRGGLNAA